MEFKNIVSDILKNNVIVDLNYFLKEEKASIFDYKKASKNTSELQDLATKLLKDYEKDVKRAKTRSSSEQWNAFKNQNMQ